jgi:hypothetical protein
MAVVFSALEKNAMICSQRAILPIQLGVTALLQIVIAVWRNFFFKFELPGLGLIARC